MEEKTSNSSEEGTFKNYETSYKRRRGNFGEDYTIYQFEFQNKKYWLKQGTWKQYRNVIRCNMHKIDGIVVTRQEFYELPDYILKKLPPYEKP